MSPPMMARRSKVTKPAYRSSRTSSRCGVAELLEESAIAPSKMKQEPLGDGTKLVFSMDYGTKTLAIAFWISRPDKICAPADIYDIQFQGKSGYEAPQIIAWDFKGDILWGHELQSKIKKGNVKVESVIKLWKLLLYSEHCDSMMANRILTQLEKCSKNLDTLLEQHFKAIMKDVMITVRRSQAWLHMTEAEIDALPVEVLISVPQMWEADGTIRMINAATNAGIKNLQLVYEPQCAAAFFTHTIKNHLPAQLKVGDTMLVADLGGGTADCASYRFESNPNEGAAVSLMAVGSPEGSLDGSEFVNEHFQKSLMKCLTMRSAGGFEQVCKDLGLSQDAALAQANVQFDTIKHEFEPDQEMVYIKLRGAQRRPSQNQPTFEIALSSDEIRASFDAVIDNVIVLVGKQMTSDTKVIIVPGGFGTSEYLIQRLRSRFEHGSLMFLKPLNQGDGSLQPVSRGALLRYHDIRPCALPSDFSFGVGQVEIYNAKQHPDATVVQKGDPKEGGGEWAKSQPDFELVKQDPIQPDMSVVENRWVTLLNKGEIIGPGKIFKSHVWQMQYPKPQDESFSTQIYITKNDIQDHEPIYEGKKLRPGIRNWGAEIVRQIPDLENLGFELKEYRNEKKKRVECYEVWWRLVLECNGANVDVNWQIALPGTQPFDESGKSKTTEAEMQLADDQVYTVNDEKHSAFPRTSAA